MFSMKKIIAVLLCVMMVFAFSSCSDDEVTIIEDDSNLDVVVTVYPEYDWVKNIAGQVPVNITLLLDNGVDLHSYQPTTEDLVTIGTSGLFVYVGGESDAWVDSALTVTSNPAGVNVNLMEALGEELREEEVKEGMQAETEEEDEDEVEYDEHVWLSLKNAVTCVNAILDGMCEADPENADAYKVNASAYIKELEALDSEYASVVSEAKNNTLVFGDRFPFLYMTKDYGLDYYAAFVGCSAESEASFETVAFLSSKVDELGLKYVLAIEGSNNGIAQTVADNATAEDVSVLTINSLQSVTSQDLESGELSYIGIMTENLEVLRTALN